MPDKHALLGPSSAHRWLVCTPCARLEEQFPNESSAFAEEGTRAHSICEQKLYALIGEPYPNETACAPDDDEMERCTDEYRDFVEEELNAAKAKTPDARLFIEQQFNLADYVPESFGTSDAVIISDDTLEIVDFKYGKGVQVNAAGNPQLRLYALGTYLSLGSLYDFTKIKTVVFQPRINHIDSEELELTALLDWAENYVKPRARLAIDGKGDFVVGEHCRFCRAGVHCRARVSEAFEVIDKSDASPDVLTDDEIAPILDKLDTAEKWIAAVRQYAQDEAIRGKKWPGYKLVEGRTNRKILDQIKAASVFEKAGYSQEEYTTTKLKGITELERLVGKVELTRMLDGILVKPKGEPQLVKESDKRDEINPLEEVFKED